MYVLLLKILDGIVLFSLSVAHHPPAQQTGRHRVHVGGGRLGQEPRQQVDFVGTQRIRESPRRAHRHHAARLLQLQRLTWMIMMVLR